MLPRFTTVGRLTRDPELRVTTGGLSICKFSIATSEKYKDKEDTCFLDIDAFGKQAEVISKHFHKGKPITVQVKMKTDKWQTQDGQERSKMGFTLESFGFVPESKSEQGQGNVSRDSVERPDFTDSSDQVPF